MKNEILRGEKPKRNLIVEIIAAILLVFFVHLLTSSYIELQSLRNLLVFYTKNPTEAVWTILIVELATVILLLFRKTRKTGFILTILIFCFGIYILLGKPNYPHAFGGILNNLSPNKQLIIYSLLLLLSVIGIGMHTIKGKNKNIEEAQTAVFT